MSNLAPVVTVVGTVYAVTDRDFTDDKGTVTRSRHVDVLTPHLGGFARVKYPADVPLPEQGASVALVAKVSNWVQNGQRGLTFLLVPQPAK